MDLPSIQKSSPTGSVNMAEAQSNVEHQNPELWEWHREDGRFSQKLKGQFESIINFIDMIKKPESVMRELKMC